MDPKQTETTVFQEKENREEINTLLNSIETQNKNFLVILLIFIYFFEHFFKGLTNFQMLILGE